MAQHSAPPDSSKSGSVLAGLSRRTLIGWGAGIAVLVVVAIVALMAFGGESSAPQPSTADGPAASDGVGPSGEDSGLPISSTFTTVDGTAGDPRPTAENEGIVVHPIRETPVYDQPAGQAIARVETQQFGDAWFPVIDDQEGWVQVLLPSKPNGSTGWLRADDVERARTPYLVRVHLGSMTLELLRGGQSVGEWTIGIGKDSAPTPTGRTYLMGAFRDPNQSFSPVILPLGAHSPTLDSFGGGPGTVAIHTWPTDDVYGTASSDGCLRVPPAALDRLTEVPLGTLVLIDEG